LDPLFFVGGGMALLLVTVVGIWAGRRVKTASDFDRGGGKVGTIFVVGSLIGTSVGGASTVGTAQLAFNYGMTACWFTAGIGFACLMIGLFFWKPIRSMGEQGIATYQGKMSREFGPKIGLLTALLIGVSLFGTIVPQLVSGTAVIKLFFPDTNLLTGGVLVAIFIIIYVVFGGMWGAGMVGIVKVVLLYVAVVAGGGLVIFLAGGLSPVREMLTRQEAFQFFARGIDTDFGGAVSVVIGSLCTQTIAQTIMAARSGKAARKASLISACLIPPIGFGSILMGQYMRSVTPAEVLADPSARAVAAMTAFPQFILNFTPPLLAGVIIATLFIVVVGTGAGLALGLASIIRQDITSIFTKRFDDPKQGLMFSRISIIVCLMTSVLISAVVGSNILGMAFWALGIRATTAFFPLMCALFLPGRIRSSFVLTAMLAGIFCLILGAFVALPISSTVLGICANLFVMVLGLLVGKKKEYKGISES